uniref:Uncharacterized protein n=1 Tax=Amphimedon queenslandica TaxID=400682 RepID=A0A1X7VHZ7_AMPQE
GPLNCLVLLRTTAFIFLSNILSSN